MKKEEHTVKNEQDDKLNLEESFRKLEDISARLEAEDVTLEESFSLYESGMKLLQNCNEMIDHVEKKVMELGKNGEKNEF